MPRSLWNGTVSFGLVNVPVKLFSAVESKTVHFQRGPRRGRRADRAPALLLQGGQRGPLRRGRQGLRAAARASSSCSTRRRSTRRPATRAHVIDVEAFVCVAEIDPVVLREVLLPRRRREGRGRVPAAARRAGEHGPRGAGPLHVPQPRVPRRDPPARQACSRCTRCASPTSWSTPAKIEFDAPQQGPGQARGRDGAQAGREPARGVPARAATRTSTARRCSS